MGPGDLDKALCGLEPPHHPDLLVGLGTNDDAGVYKLKDDLAIIQTVDFFTPIVDDPFSFGQIAAANALSDVYAMGGRPLTAMNIICFPRKTMGIEILREILKGGLEKIKEAGAYLVGGHSIEDDELKYGLSVTGTVHPDKYITNRGAKRGDSLIITKPLGTGIINTAIKGNLAGEDLIHEVTSIMSALNRPAAEEFKSYAISSCTDVTGFGLLGHACEMIEESDVGLVIYPDRVPFISQTIDFANMGIVPGGTTRNKEYRKTFIILENKISAPVMDILFDPQTSGGLLIAVSGDQSKKFLERLSSKGLEDATLIGEFVNEPKGKIVLRSDK